MSLEQALAANTAALQALTAALCSNPQSVAPLQPAPSTAAVAPVPTAPVVQTDISPLPTAAFAPPVPPAPSAAPIAAPLMVPPADNGNVERDSAGMPWDGRIHAATKNKVADGTWRYKRGCDEAVIKQVEAELRGAAAAPVPVVGGVGTPWPFSEEPTHVAAAVPAPVVAPAPAAPVAVPLPPAAPVTTGIASYEQLMVALPFKIVSGELTAQQLQQACEQFGVPSIAALASRPDLVASVAAVLGLR